MAICGHEQVVVAVGVEVARVDPHAPLGVPVPIDRHPGQPCAVQKGAIPLIEPKLVGLAIVGDVQILPPVAVEVGRDHPQRRPVLPAPQRVGRHVREPPVPAVAQQPVRHRHVALRPAVVLLAGAVEALDQVVETRVDVVADVQVQPAVAVVVDEGGRDAPAPIIRACSRGHVRERAVAVVAQQVIGAQPGPVDVDPAVVVDVAGSHSHAVAADVETASGRHVGEAQRPRAVRVHAQVVPVQAVARPGRGPCRRAEQGVLQRLSGAEHLALHQVDVEVSVVVEVEQRPARPHDLGRIVLAGHTVEVHEVEPRSRRAVREPRIRMAGLRQRAGRGESNAQRSQQDTERDAAGNGTHQQLIIAAPSGVVKTPVPAARSLRRRTQRSEVLRRSVMERGGWAETPRQRGVSGRYRRPISASTASMRDCSSSVPGSIRSASR